MVRAYWSQNKLIVEQVSPEKEAELADFVQETLDLVGIAVFEGMAYSTEATAREKLEF